MDITGSKHLHVKEGTRIVVTWSGGLDSTTLVGLLLKEYNAKVFPIFINRRQKNLEKELGSVDYFSSVFRTKYSNNFHQPLIVTLERFSSEIRELYPDAGINKLYALRNSDITNQAVRYALALSVNVVAVGSNVDDTFGDSSLAYWKAKQTEVQVGVTDDDFQVIAPFQEFRWGKSEMIAWAQKNDLPIHESWSCWKGGKVHCGECPPCESRKKAYDISGATDLTKYETEE